MIITLTSAAGTVTLNDEASPGYLINREIVGLGLPKRRLSTGERTDRDGGYVGAHRYGMRDISIPLLIHGTGVSEFETLRRDFFDVIEGGEVTVDIVTNDFRAYTLETILVDADFPYDPNPLKCEGNLELTAPDPILYDNSTPGSSTVTLPRQTGGGLTWPLTWPLSWAAGSGATNAINSGSATVYPTITLTGSMTNPIITNAFTGEVFKLDPLVTSVGDIVIINMNPTKRTILLNGGNIAASKTNDASWISLPRGTNPLTLTTSSGSDTVSGTVTWKPGVKGI